MKMTNAWCVLYVAALLLGCASTPPPPRPGEMPMSEGVRVLADVKSQSEQWTRELKKDTALASGQKMKAQALYIPAKAAIDAWVAALKVELASGRSSIAPEYQRSLDQAAEKGQAYVIYVNQLYVKGAVAAATPLIGDLVKLIPDMAFKIWKDYRDAEEARNKDRMKAILEQLDALKWEPFDKV